MKPFRALSFLAAFIATTIHSDATTYFVNVNSTNPAIPYLSWSTAATNIQSAANIASFGSTILVTNGTYQTGGSSINGSNRVTITVGNLLVQSVNGPAVTIIKGNQVPGTTNGTAAMRGVYLGPGSVLSGFTVTGGATPNANALGGGVLCASPTAVVTNCWVVNNASAAQGGGIDSGIAINCIISNNWAVSSGGGLYQGIANHCIISGNNSPQGGGVYMCTVYDSLLTGNGNTNSIGGTQAGAAYAGSLYNCTISGNFSTTLGAVNAAALANSIVYYNSNGGFADCVSCRMTNSCATPASITSGSPNVNCITNPPAFLNAAGGNFHVQLGSPTMDAGLSTAETNSTDLDGNPRIIGAAVDMGAYESQSTNLIHYVSLASTNPVAPYTNWVTAATNLEAAIAVAQPGELVAANAGIYTNDSVVIFGAETNRVAVTNGVTLLGIYGPASTMILGGLQTRGAYVGTNSVISGFTITNGQASLTGDVTNEQSGGGVWCMPSASVVNCLVISNFAGNRNNFVDARIGGGVYGGTISNSTLMDNYAGSGGGAGNASMWNCLMTSNSANVGGGAYRCFLTNCTAINNSAIYNGMIPSGGGVAQCMSYNCLLTGNTNAMLGGGSYQGTNYYCTISGNMASSEGGGAYQSTNYNCFITGNIAAQSGGGGAYMGSLYNCVVNGNSAPDGMGGGTANAILVNCTVTGNSAFTFGGGVDGGTAYNSIIYFNTAPNNPNWTTATLLACCSIPKGGTGSITNNPSFVDAADGDYRLGCGSPCIEAGTTNSGILGTTNDIRGLARPNLRSAPGAPLLDMGAYAYISAVDEVPVIHEMSSFSVIATSYPLALVAQMGSCPDYFWWNFGDGVTVSNLSNVTHSWTAPGTYNVQLQAYYSSLGQVLATNLVVQVVQQPVYYVSMLGHTAQAPYTTFAGAATSIQQAIAAGTLPGRLVLVTNGTYHTTGSLANGPGAFEAGLTNAVMLESINGPQFTTILSLISGVRGCFVNSNSFLSGFTITGGQALNTGDTNRDQSGGGIWCQPGGVVSNCVVFNNTANSSGSGAFQGTYSNCVFTNNLGMGTLGQGCGVAYATLYDCLIISNWSNLQITGMGASHCTLYNCTLTGNGRFLEGNGGGAANSTLYDCTVTGNEAGNGGGLYLSTALNCLVASNNSSTAGGAYNSTLQNCTVAGNSATGDPGGTSGGAATNCIISFNLAGDGSVSSNWNGGTFSWCCTTPLPGTGVATITNDPEFVDSVNGDFHLQATSPCINAGNNAFVYGVTDLDGNPRIMGGTVDMGVYEFQAQVTGTFDSWLAQYNLPTDGSADDADSDGTGMSNWQKWIAGLNPTNSASVLAMQSPAGTNNSAGITVTWQSVSTRSYSLQRTTSLTAPFITLQTNIPGQDGTTTYNDTTAVGAGPYFYRVSVQ